MASEKSGPDNTPASLLITEAIEKESRNSMDQPRPLAFEADLPPMDEGRAAYGVLAAVTLLSMMPFGVISSFGVFFQYYVLQRYEHADRAVWIGGISNGIMSLFAPLMVYACLKLTPQLPLLYYIGFGWLLSFVALLSAAFCRSVALLILTQGVLLGIGALFVGYPSLMILNSWFVKRRGFAYGICFASTKLVSIGLGFLINYSLHAHGRKTTFFIMTALVGAVPLAALPFVHERGASSPLKRVLPVGATGSAIAEIRPTSTLSTISMVRPYYYQVLFYVMLVAYFLESVGYAIPKFYISTYSADILGLPTYTGPLLLALYNTTGVISKPLFGHLSDLGPPQLLMVLTTIACAISMIVFWGVASMLSLTSARLGMLATFITVFSFAGQGFSSLASRMSRCFRQMSSSSYATDETAPLPAVNEKSEASVSVRQQNDQGRDDSQQVYAWLNVARGTAYMVSAPTSEVLLNPANDSELGTYGLVRSRAFAGGPGWRSLIVFSAVLMIAATFMSVFAWVADRSTFRASIRRKKSNLGPERDQNA
ncbi:uncharacterized protein AB675_1530 [Cyphellophora attinorum]|uniref:Transporter MCH4 n=1 Tax=Cyphellophora attinorum TaxID=1664694 RepID=A0A0N1NZ82_9EURO|nr:uncharacterized protein AB675_1530 [Phialophora attinorum]KPI37215.1 hypothetical protein AB675_1530 [Phialophora attinorum]